MLWERESNSRPPDWGPRARSAEPPYPLPLPLFPFLVFRSFMHSMGLSLMMLKDKTMIKLKHPHKIMCIVRGELFWFGWFLVSSSSSAARLSRGRVPRLTSDSFKCGHTETEWGDQDFCLNRSLYTDMDPKHSHTHSLRLSFSISLSLSLTELSCLCRTV